MKMLKMACRINVTWCSLRKRVLCVCAFVRKRHQSGVLFLPRCSWHFYVQVTTVQSCLICCKLMLYTYGWILIKFTERCWLWIRDQLIKFARLGLVWLLAPLCEHSAEFQEGRLAHKEEPNMGNIHVTIQLSGVKVKRYQSSFGHLWLTDFIEHSCSLKAE